MLSEQANLCLHMFTFLLSTSSCFSVVIYGQDGQCGPDGSEEALLFTINVGGIFPANHLFEYKITIRQDNYNYKIHRHECVQWR